MTSPDVSRAARDTDPTEAIRARADAATDGPWDTLSPRADGASPVIRDDPERGGRVWIVAMTTEADAEFIAHAREDVPWLLDALAESRAETERLRAAVERVEALCDEADWQACNDANPNEPIVGVDRIRAALAPPPTPSEPAQSGPERASRAES